MRAEDDDYTDEYVEALVEGMVAGASPTQIAATLGVPVECVARSYFDVMSDSLDLYIPALQTRARVIRDRYKAGGVTQDGLAREYCVSLSTVRHILQGRTWKEGQ